MLRPVGSEYLIRFSAKQHIEGHAQFFGNNIGKRRISIWRRPSSISETSRRVFIRTARCLHHSIKADHGKNNYIPHAFILPFVITREIKKWPEDLSSGHAI